MDIDDAIVAVVIGSSNGLQELAAGEDVARVAGKSQQELAPHALPTGATAGTGMAVATNIERPTGTRSPVSNKIIGPGVSISPSAVDQCSCMALHRARAMQHLAAAHLDARNRSVSARSCPGAPPSCRMQKLSRTPQIRPTNAGAADQRAGQRLPSLDGTAGGIAVDWALAQVGTPYVWGGETPGVGFDCFGLVQAAYRIGGITLPRVAQDQYDAGRQLPPGTPLLPGDLVFFGGGPSDVSHVGIYVGVQGGRAVMVDAPHTGAEVRVEPFPHTIGAPWGGTDLYLGATRPAT